MQLKTAMKCAVLAVSMVHVHPGASWAASGAEAGEMRTITQSAYRAGPHDTPETARALALYGAKHKAVVRSAEDLARRGMLKNYGDQQPEIFCLVADEVNYRMVAESFSEKSGTATIEIESEIALTDFVHAEIRNAALEQQEMQFSLQEEMEPVISPAMEPGQELSRAYRYISRNHWRMAIIYLDHLETKYPHWDALFMAKAMGFSGMHEAARAMAALAAACSLGNQEACLKIDTRNGSE